MNTSALVLQISSFLSMHTPLYYFTQSFWRDEAFSYVLASLPMTQIILHTARDFNPPLYYLILHIWIMGVGKSDIGIRILSFIFHLGTTYVSYRIGTKIQKSWGGMVTACMVFFNPMLLYYSAEARMYALYVLCLSGSILSLMEKKYTKYTIWTTLGLYTHSYFIAFPLTVLGIACIKRNGTLIKKGIVPLLLFLPWIPVLVTQFTHAGDSWIYPLAPEQLPSIVGDLFIGYEGTPDGYWIMGAKISRLILCLCAIACFFAKRQSRWLLALAAIPLIGCIEYSLFLQPVFVNRYMIGVSLLESLLIVYAISALPTSVLQYTGASVAICWTIWLNHTTILFHHKLDYRGMFKEINQHAISSDIILATQLNALESLYYFKYPDHVIIYNPTHEKIPSYIGITTVAPTISHESLPEGDRRMFSLSDNATFDIMQHTSL